jgi:hypothetical protein
LTLPVYSGLMLGPCPLGVGPGALAAEHVVFPVLAEVVLRAHDYPTRAVAVRARVLLRLLDL